MKASTFTISVTLGILLTSVLVFVTNYVVDPYGKNLRFNYSFNHTKAIRDERISKFELLEQHPEAVNFIFGSSKALLMDPRQFQQLTGQPALNMAFSSATADEYYLYIRYLLQTRKVSSIIIGIDYFAYSEGFHSNGTLPQTLRNYFGLDNDYSLGNYLSYAMLKESVRTLYYNRPGRQWNKVVNRYSPRGQILIESYLSVKNDPAAYRQYIQQQVIDKPPRWGAKTTELSKNNLAYLQDIRDLCMQHHVKLSLYMSPLYIQQITMKQNFFPYQKNLLRYIVHNIAPVYDFNGITAVNTDPYAYLNEFHFNYETSAQILQQVVTGKGGERYSGTYVTRDNLQAYLISVDKRLQKIDTAD